MKDWSDDPIHEKFCVKFFLDTMILVYIIDESNKMVAIFLDLLSNNPFARIVSSSFVIYEFIGIRKREHYVRIAAENCRETNHGCINYHSLFNNIDSFDNQNAKFEQEIEKIRDSVNSEINRIKMDFNIDIEYSKFHEEQLQSARDVCLSSKIANQDSMVLISSVFPQPSKNNEVVILTNDTQFYTAFNKGKVSDILQNLNICSPKFINLDTLGKMNLAGVESLQRDDNNKINLYLFNLITKQLKNFFLGKTFTPSGENLPNNCICFKLIDGVPLKNGIYVSVLSKELDFIYTSKKPVRFWNNGAEIFDGFTSSEGNKNISYLITEVDENSIEIPIPNEVLAAIKAEGNHVFVHPDTLLP